MRLLLCSQFQEDRGIRQWTSDGSLLSLSFSGILEDTEHNEFGRTNGRYSDLADQATVQDVVLRHRGSIADHEKCLLLGAAKEGSIAPLTAQKSADRVDHAGPQTVVIRLEHNPLRAFVD